MNYPAVNIPTKIPMKLNHSLTELNPQNTKKSTAKINEDSTTSCQIWEENYQDLSDWCMDTFIRAPCDFPAGELNQNEIKDCIEIKDEQEVIDANQNKIYSMNNMGDEVWGKDLKQELQLINNNNSQYDNDLLTDLNGWQNVLKKDEWIQQIDNDQIGQTEKYENWDTLNVFNNNNSFDLLSYLCDKDDIFSLEENISTDSTTILSNNNNNRTINNNNNSYEKIKSELLISSTVSSPEFNEINCLKMKLPSTDRSIENTKVRGRQRVEVVNSIQLDKGTKRNYDSDDGLSDCSSNYKDSREKNNQASKKSRMNKKVKENEMELRAMILENDNKKLKIKAEQLEKLVIKMRSTMLQFALQKNN
ncbi:putative uncharacterized protein DDB_G0282133 [Aphidius gifuensis]|uniref:putative uncharacterized protein DDB_G0282133 n=1 Tax=Aphidius gifuensis TaxID=684658 RepID=UPI001CDBE3E7|nr:putative uncharacterized protein DDB_G0282133 [Aphidius gifuensis]